MASQTLRHRPNDNNAPSISSTSPSPNPTATTTTKTNKRTKKLAMARKGLKSLAMAVIIPSILTAIDVYLCGCNSSNIKKRTWHPPIWIIHLATISTSALMGLAAWLVWAEGVFHKEPGMFGLYLAQFLLGLAWAPLVIQVGAVRVGLGVSLAMFGVMMMCAMCFKKVNPIAGDLVKPCVAWVSFLVVFNYKLLR